MSCSTSNEEKVETVKFMEMIEIDGDVTNIPSTSQETNKLVGVESQTQHYDELEVYSLRKKIKSLKQKVRRKELKISNMKNLIQEISKSGCSNENLDSFEKLF
ncbi:hypothetical protein ILUMI_22344 [Ignelater luminosus]|uniref:Uncharacterized protein n=1 Tax=Ignelater luminosus TaxID=2038154 RepID=A0A8K0G2Z6_IGNLU|nr:hypothetical protein ILUMI_22344 [Ignelater luminosus]